MISSMDKQLAKVAVIVPNWNGAACLAACLDSLLAQSLKACVIVVDNGSVDGSLELLETYSDIEIIKHEKNKGFAGGVNAGFERAIKRDAKYVAAFNNDAVADTRWLERLVRALDENPEQGIATCKLLSVDGKHIDSTGDYYTSWGLPYSRGRGETDSDKYDNELGVFGASGGASLYCVKMLKEIGLFDEDFFAYYEDVDLSFRAQLMGWKVCYVPKAIAYHQIGATSSKLKGFTTYQTLKNLPMLLVKNVPRRHLYKVAWRYSLAQTLFFGRAVSRGHGWYALKGKVSCVLLLPSTLKKRRHIQRSKTVSDEYIWNILTHDLPPNAQALRKLRVCWRKLQGKSHE